MLRSRVGLFPVPYPARGVCRDAALARGAGLFPSYRFLIVFIVLLFAAVSTSSTALAASGKTGGYAVNLAWSQKAFSAKDVEKVAGLTGGRFYTTRFRVQGEPWHLLRYGIFSSKKEAKKALDRLKGHFPRARLAEVTTKESAVAAKNELVPAAVLSGSAAVAASVATTATRGAGAADPIGEARKAIARGDYFQAIQILEVAVTSKNATLRAEALDQLAVAYERDGQTDLAVKRYRQYLADFPKGPAVEQVRARLDELKRLAAGERPTVDSSLPYVINLASSRDRFDSSNIASHPVFEHYRLYMTAFEREGKTWYRLRIGFFPTRSAAEGVMKDLRGGYPKAWVAKSSLQERKNSADRLVVPRAGPAVPVAPAVPSGRKAAEKPVSAPGGWPVLSPERISVLMDEAEVAMAGGDYGRAVQLYTKVLRYPGHPHRQRAQELLGLARERKGQFAHARAEYEEYLRLYPKGEDAERVRQRLRGLITRKAEPKAKLKVVRRKETRNEFYGSFSQFYYRDESFTDLFGDNVNRSSLDSNLDATYRYRDENVQVRSRVSAGYELSFLSDQDDISRLTALYVEALHRAWRVSGRVGRQSGSSGGVLGRYDGFTLGYEVLPKLRVNLVGGFPVFSSTDVEINTERKFWGVNADVGTFFDRWDANLFFIDQYVDGINDRRAVGGEVRYFRPGMSLFSLVDYDIHFNELNTALLTATYTLPTRSTINLQADYRKSPFLTALNALQGQTVFDISDLLNFFTEDEIRALARDRTADSWLLQLGASHPVNSWLQISGDITATELSSTPGSGGVDPIPGTGVEFFYNLQFIGNGLIKPGDIAIVGLRFADTQRSNALALNLNTRYPISRLWRVNPRFRVDFKKNENSTDELIVRGAVRTEYRWRRYFTLDLEGGGEWSDFSSETVNDQTLGYFISVGYRYDF